MKLLDVFLVDVFGHGIFVQVEDRMRSREDAVGLATHYTQKIKRHKKFYVFATNEAYSVLPFPSLFSDLRKKREELRVSPSVGQIPLTPTTETELISCNELQLPVTS